MFTSVSDVKQLDLQRFVFFEKKAGFADRFNHMQRAIQAGAKLQVPVYIYWPVNHLCNAHYLSFFDSIEGVLFIDENVATQLRSHHGKIDETLIKENSVKNEPTKIKFLTLKLQAKYIETVKAFVADNDIKRTIGFHIRKTDIANKEKKRGTTIQYQLFNQITEKSTKRIFLATDNINVRKEFIERYGERIILYDTEFNQDKLRQTTLETSIIELFILAHCSEFYGTTIDSGKLFSAFSKMAKLLGEARRQNTLPGFENIDKPGKNDYNTITYPS